MIRHLIPMLLVVIALALPRAVAGAEAEGDDQAEGLPYPEIEDPVGLGPRLALIDHMRDELGLDPQAGASLEQLLAAYWKHRGEDALALARGDTPPSQEEDPWEEAAREQERRWKLRMRLRDRHDVETAEDIPLEKLEALVARFERAERAERERSRPDPTAQPGPADGGDGVRAEVVGARVEPSDPTQRPAVAETGDAELDRWLKTVADCWERYAAVTEPWELRYPGDVLPAQQDGFRIERAGGTIEVLDAAPESPEGIVRYWWARKSNGRADTPLVWSPAEWDPQRGEWLTTPLAHNRLNQVDGRWKTLMNALLSHPAIEDPDALRAWMRHHNDEVAALKSTPSGYGASRQVAEGALSARQTAQAAIDELFAPVEKRFGVDLGFVQQTGVTAAFALAEWQAFERGFAPVKTGNTEASTRKQQIQWMGMVRPITQSIDAQRRSLAVIVHRMSRGRLKELVMGR